MLNHWARCALVLLPSLAAAAPIDDVRNGTNLFLNGITVKVDGEYSSTGGWEIPKSAGTLDIDLTLAHFGINNNQPIHATGTQVNNTIVWTFNKTFNPPVRLDSSTEVKKAWGQLLVQAEPLTSAETAACAANGCERNVRLTRPISMIFVSGEGPLDIDFTEFVDVRSFKMLAGVGRPVLTGFGGMAPIYQRDHDQWLMVPVFLDRPAPSGGAKVELWSGASQAPFWSNTSTVPQGASSTTVGLKIPAWFVGTFQIRAWSGGATDASTVTVRPEADTDSNNPFDVAEWVPDAAAGCIMCNGFVSRPGEDVSISMISGIPSIVERGRIRDMRTVLGAANVNPVAITNTGWSVGTLVNAAGVTSTYAANVTNTRVPKTLYTGLSPVGITSGGYMLANRTAGVPMAGFATRGQFKPLALPVGTKTSNATALSNLGHVTGTMVDASGTYAFRFVEGQTTKLAKLATLNDFKPVAINASAEVAAYSEDKFGNRSAMRVTRNNSTQSLGTLSGATSVWPTSQNDLGWIVGTAKRSTGTTGFLWTRSGGMVDLNKLTPSTRFVVLEALNVTNDKQILVRANNNGRVDLYLLTPGKK